MDFNSKYEISRTSDFIHSRNFSRVALQFPDELLKDSMKFVYYLREELKYRGLENVKLFIMADTAYGSCCIDEVGASHVDADCVIHYGHTCLSPTSILPALCIFGKSFIDVNACVESLSNCMAKCTKSIIVLYGLEYAHAIPRIREIMAGKLSESQKSTQGFHYADTMYSILDPFTCGKTCNGTSTSCDNFSSNEDNLKEFDIKNCEIKQIESKEEIPTMSSSIYRLGGLKWNLPKGHKVGDYLLFWIGDDNPAFTNAVLTFNFCEIVRYDTEKNVSVTDFSHHKRILKRRYYLVEKAKDSNIIGILVGTLGVAGYLSMIHQMKDLIKKAGKKSYTLVMGRPNPAKLANFPECDLFIYVSCAQTALLDSKEFLAPVITPFEAVLAFNRGSQWTGAYVMEFQELMASPLNASEIKEAARFSFLEGGYVEDLDPLEKQIEGKEQVQVLAETMEKSLQTIDNYIDVRGKPRSGAEFFTTRSFRGLDIPPEKSAPLPYVTGRTGRAAGYNGEKTKVEDTNASNTEIIN